MFGLLLTMQECVCSDAEQLDKLINMVAAGDSEAFESLYVKTKVSVYSYSLSVLKDKHDAEDVMHDCYVNIYHAAAGYKSHGKPLAWILTIAKHLCYDMLKHKSRTINLTDEEWEFGFTSDDSVDIEDRLLLNHCFSALTDEERKIIVLHVVSGFKHRETASFLELPVATVLSKYHRAIGKLKHACTVGTTEIKIQHQERNIHKL